MPTIPTLLILAVSSLLVLTGCTGGRTGEEVYAPSSTITVVPSSVVLPTSLAPNTDIP